MLLGAQYEDIRLNTNALQLLNAMLRGLGFQLTGSLEVRNISKVYVDSILAQFPFHLSDGLKEGCALDIADGTADFGNHEVVVVLAAELLDVALDFVGNMGHHLDGLAQIVAAALLVDD